MKRPVQTSAVPEESWYKGTDREIRGRALSDVDGKAKIGFGYMELPPGSNTKPGHWHTREEEHLYALAGEATLHLGALRFPLVSGSYVCFPAGQAEPHFIDNMGSTVFVYLIVGERLADDEVIYQGE